MTYRCAVLGSPIAHSLSPVLHRAAYAHLGLSDWAYDAYDVDAAALPGFLAELDDSWRGLSLTMPLKQVVLPLLASVSELAGAVGAVNTVLREPGAALHGDNTDVPGLVNAMREPGLGHVGWAVVLGGGATARSAVAALASLTDRVTVCIRTPSRADELLETGSRFGVAVSVRPWEARGPLLAAPLVVATTPPGVLDALVDELPDRPGVLFDVVYEPWPTRVATAWAERGGEVLGGLDLLVHQAAIQVRLMTGLDAPAHVLRTAGAAALAARTDDR